MTSPANLSLSSSSDRLMALGVLQIMAGARRIQIQPASHSPLLAPGMRRPPRPHLAERPLIGAYAGAIGIKTGDAKAVVIAAWTIRA